MAEKLARRKKEDRHKKKEKGMRGRKRTKKMRTEQS